jgi:two-component sensor histidine kinase/PAS domain-containing protein
VARALRGEQVHGKRFILTSADGRDVNILTSAAPLLADGRLVGSVVVWHDITERERLLADLAAERARLKAIIDNAPEAIVVTDSASRIALANPAAEQLFGRPLPCGEDFNSQAALALCSPDGAPCALRDLPLTRSTLDGETLTSLDMAIAWPDGRRRDLLVSSAPIRDDAGRASGAVGIFQDITQRKQAEEQLKAAVAENEVLMREIYHRVKNNIQTLISLMDMQAEFMTDPDSRAMIQELQVRARTMSLVHEQLYQSGNLAQIDFGTYLNDLMANLSRAFGADRPIVWDIDAADVLLGVDIAIPCGLIVNELLTNAMKYAFPNARPIVERGETECKIHVEFRAEGNRFTLVVADNGVGLPPGLDWRTTKSLGMQLISVLACHQLGGQVEVDTRAGTTFKITFAERKKKRK